MSEAVPSGPQERLLTFEVAQTVYALPIAEVHEVVESAAVCCVPTLPLDRGGVMNWHGEALPVIAPELILEARGAGAVDESGKRILVLSARADEPPCLGLPVDRVFGLVDGPAHPRLGRDLVVERRPLDGRVVSVLDPQCVVTRAGEVIEREVGVAGLAGEGR